MTDKRPSRRALSAAAALVTGVVALGACGSSTKSATTSPTAAPSSTTSASTTSPSASTSAPATSSSSTQTAAASSATQTLSGPGITPTEIKIGQITTTSGPVPGLFQSADYALDAYVAYINSQGGLDGHRLVVVHKDDAYNCVNYTNALKALTTEVFAVVGTFTIEDGCGQSVLTANPGFPDLQAYFLNPELMSSPNAFAASIQPPGFPTTGYEWVKAKYPADITHTASLYVNTATAEFKEQSAAAESVGFKYVYTRGIGPSETNFTSDILRMKADGVKVVDLGAQGPVGTAAQFLQQAAQQGFHPDVILDLNAYNSMLWTLLGPSGAPDASNLIMPNYFPMYLGEDRASNPELNTYLTWLQKVHPGAPGELYGTAAWAAGVLFTQAVKAAGSNVTQASLIQSVKDLGTFSANGLLPPDNPGKGIGPHCMVIVGTQGAKFVRIDPSTSGFECNGSYFNVPLSSLG